MPGESLSFNITADDRASSSFRDVGRSALDASGKIGVAAAALKLWDDTTIRSGRAADTLTASMKTHARAIALADDAYRLLSGDTLKTTKLLADQGRQLDTTGQKAKGAATGIAALVGAAGAGGGAAGAGMTGAVIAGTALAPVLVSVALGLGGVALAGKSLASNQAFMGRTLAPLKAEYQSFQQVLNPVLVGDFAAAARLAAHGLSDLLPVSIAVGKALGGVLGQIDAEFQSRQWQQFFTFMGQTAAGDIQLLGKTFVSLLGALPPLLTALQPLSAEILKDASGIAVLTSDTAKLINATQRLGTSTYQAGQQAQHSGGILGYLAARAKDAFDQLFPGVPILSKIRDDLHILGNQDAPKAAGGLHLIGAQSSAASIYVQNMATAVKNLNTAQANALTTLTTYSGDLITTATDALSLRQALKASHDEIGLQTAAQRASFTAANTYITDLSNTAQQAFASGKGVKGAMMAIRDGLPILDSAKTKNRLYWQEVQALVGWLHKLEAIKNIREVVIVRGTGSWTMNLPANQSLPGNFPGGTGAAAGMLVTGGTPGRDSVPIMAMPGEAVVPRSLTPAVAPFLKAHGVPGFAQGGIVGAYNGALAGLGPWAAHDWSASVRIIGTSIARGIAAAFTAGGVAGPGGGNPAANAALAYRLYASQLSPASWSAWNYVAMRESGWNQFARNPSSGAYGIAQALPPTKYPLAGQAAGGSNPMAQITWMWNYMKQVYGGPLGAEAHELAFNWYDKGGFLPQGLSLAYNATGHPEMVVPRGPGGRAGGGTVINVNVKVGHGTNPVQAAREIAEVLNTGARSGVRLRPSILALSG